MKKAAELKLTTNSTVDDRLRRNYLRCPYCRPHKGENKTLHRKHGVKKPKHKNKRGK